MSLDENLPPSFFARFALAFVLFWRLLFNPELARRVLPVHRGETALSPGAPKPRVTSPIDDEPMPVITVRPRSPAETSGFPAQPRPASQVMAAQPSGAPQEASGLYVLSLLQREGRLVDFLQEEVTSFSDAEVGAAARVVHEGCRKALKQLVDLEPVYADAEGGRITIPAGYDAQRVQLTGNVAGQPPHVGELKHRGWTVTNTRFPKVSAAVDAKVLAPAEVELP